MLSRQETASLYESLAGAYWSAVNIERALAERAERTGELVCQQRHQQQSDGARVLAEAAEQQAKALWGWAA